MAEFKIKSWNVLHIIHEMNYCTGNSPVLDKYPNESERILDIYKTILDVLDNNTVICLQEVPGDLFDLLKVNSHFKTYYLQYNRKPNLKNVGLNPYSNTYEYLVTIVPNSFLDQVVSETHYVQDYGKGGLIISFKKFILINTHLPFNETERKNILDQFYNYITSQNNQAFILIGDLNCNSTRIKESLETSHFEQFNVVPLVGYTRKGKNKNGIVEYSQIDHIVASNNLVIHSSYVAENLDMSDHSMIGCCYYE